MRNMYSRRGLDLLASVCHVPRYIEAPHIPTFMHAPLRRLSSYSTPRRLAAVKSASAVNTETFTLNEEVVQRDMAYLEQWNALANRLGMARAMGKHEEMVREVEGGLRLLDEVGAENAPVQTEALLCLEGAQAHVQLRHYEEAHTLTRRAEAVLMAPPEEQRDMAMINECRLLEAHILTLEGKGKAAYEVLERVMSWIDVDARGATPIQAVAALHLKPGVKTAMGQALVAQAKAVETTGNDMELEAKGLYAKALDALIDGLDQHIDDKNSDAVKTSLKHIFWCFEGLKDYSQALSTCKKYVSWCSQQKEDDGVAYGKAMEEDFLKRHPEAAELNTA